MECVSNLAVGNCDVVIYQVLDLRGARALGERVCWVDGSMGLAHSISIFRYEKKRRRDGIGELGSASEHL